MHDDENRGRQVCGQVCQDRRYRFDAPCRCAEDNDISLVQKIASSAAAIAFRVPFGLNQRPMSSFLHLHSLLIAS